MTPEQLEGRMELLQSEEKDIRIDRGRRYGSEKDTLANIAEFGADGAIVSFWECAMRVRNTFGKPKNYEDLKNAVQDGRNYLAYILILLEREGRSVENVPRIKSFEESRK